MFCMVFTAFWVVFTVFCVIFRALWAVVRDDFKSIVGGC